MSAKQQKKVLQNRYNLYFPNLESSTKIFFQDVIANLKRKTEEKGLFIGKEDFYLVHALSHIVSFFIVFK